jgi:hypothetical protein
MFHFNLKFEKNQKKEREISQNFAVTLHKIAKRTMYTLSDK